MSDDPAHEVLSARITNLETREERMLLAISSIDESLKALIRLDVKHDETRAGLGRAFVDIEDHETRMRLIETEMPTMKQVRSWVFSGIAGALGMIGMAILLLVLK